MPNKGVASSGFLLSRQWRDTEHGIVLKYWLHTSEGPLLLEQTEQEGIFFVEASSYDKALKLCKHLLTHNKPLKLKSFSQQAVYGFYFKRQKNLRKAASLLKQNHIEPLEADVRTIDRYLMERFVTCEAEILASEIVTKRGFLYAKDAHKKAKG